MAPWRAISLSAILLIAGCPNGNFVQTHDAGIRHDAGDAGPNDAGPGDAGSDDAGADASDGDAGDAAVIDAPDCGQSVPIVTPGPDPGMVTVAAGPFWQGCTADPNARCLQDESPGRCVTLSEYEIDITPVTNSQFALFMADAGATPPTICDDAVVPSINPTAGRPDAPVVCIPLPEAQAYCAWVGKQLPTEAQYEKAIRGTDGRIYPWGNEPPTCELAEAYEGCSDTIPDVGSSMAGDSPFGLADGTSLVAEMVSDWFDKDYYSYAPDVDPTGPAEPGSGNADAYCSVIRASEWLAPGDVPQQTASFAMETWVRSCLDLQNEPEGDGVGYGGLGFRCAKPLSE